MYQLLHAALATGLLSSPATVAAAHPASCGVESQPAAIVQNVAPDYPIIAQMQGAVGKSIVRVDLSESGKLVGSAILTSSGNILLDRSAVSTVTSMTFAPEIRGCKGLSGSYAVEVEFAR